MNSTAKATLYFLFLSLSGPLVFLCFALPSIFISLLPRATQYLKKQQIRKSSEHQKKTVLVTGAPHTKGLQVCFQKRIYRRHYNDLSSLQICRFLASAGHRVILADMKIFHNNKPDSRSNHNAPAVCDSG